jgi:hypothetical protein
MLFLTDDKGNYVSADGQWTIVHRRARLCLVCWCNSLLRTFSGDHALSRAMAFCGEKEAT